MQRAIGRKWRRAGLPQGFLALAATEYWERFALAGVKSLLTLVLIDHILAVIRIEEERHELSQDAEAHRTLPEGPMPVATVTGRSKVATTKRKDRP